jgi:hypothetical protein
VGPLGYSRDQDILVSGYVGTKRGSQRVVLFKAELVARLGYRRRSHLSPT